jgi:GT2 family glycosyltransferase
MKILIVLLEYLEPEFTQTLKCVEDTGLPYEVVSRDGVGNMSRAYNSILMDVSWQADYLWFVSNVTFDKEMPYKLAETLEKTGWAGVHPAMSTSDHRFQWKNGDVPRETPFIEWTAPMVNAELFSHEPLDEMLPYYYMDLDWCHRMREQGHKVGVDHRVEVNHVYLRNKKEHPIGQIRKQLRNYWTPISQKHMINKYGKDWQTKLWPR